MLQHQQKTWPNGEGHVLQSWRIMRGIEKRYTHVKSSSSNNNNRAVQAAHAYPAACLRIRPKSLPELQQLLYRQLYISNNFLSKSLSIFFFMLLLMRFSIKWCFWALNAACLALIRCSTPKVMLFNGNLKILFASWRRWRGEVRNQVKEDKCYMENESHRSWYSEVWAEEGHMRRREKCSIMGAQAINTKRVGLRGIWK